MIDDLQKAQEFYLKIEDKYEGQREWNSNTFPLTYKSKEDSLAFKEAFKDLDQTEQEQWFDHHYHQAMKSVFGDGESSYIKGRESFLLLLKVYILFKMKLTRKYEFGKLIHICWIKNPARFEDVRQEINDIFDSCHFNVEGSGKKNKAGCGCLPKETCNIF